jgi:hypothetical protein
MTCAPAQRCWSGRLAVIPIGVSPAASKANVGVIGRARGVLIQQTHVCDRSDTNRLSSAAGQLSSALKR